MNHLFSVSSASESEIGVVRRRVVRRGEDRVQSVWRGGITCGRSIGDGVRSGLEGGRRMDGR